MNVVIFTLDEKEYAIDITKVYEVIRIHEITAIPDTPPYVKGVTTFHNKVVPLVSLRSKLGLSDIDSLSRYRIVICKINGALIGLVVDRVVGVMPLMLDQLSPPDEVLKDATYLYGVAKINDRLILIVDVDQVLSDSEKNDIDSVQQRVEVRAKETSR